MARQKVADEIEALRKQREQLDARLKAAEARQKERERQQDDRRKLLAGNIALEFMAEHPASDFTRVLSGLLDKQLTRPTDRALFPALPSSKASLSAEENSAKTE